MEWFLLDTLSRRCYNPKRKGKLILMITVFSKPEKLRGMLFLSVNADAADQAAFLYDKCHYRMNGGRI